MGLLRRMVLCNEQQDLYLTISRDELVGVLPRIQNHLNSRSDRISEYTEMMVQEERLQELKKVLQEAQNSPNGPILNLHDR